MRGVNTTANPARWQALLDELAAGLLERDDAVRLALLAALAGENVLLIGPPGTAKSALARRLHGAFAGAPYFERLLTRFSTPEELFGPLSLKALEEDRYERLTEGFLPTAGVAFLDEVFKANSAILNALLTLLNEREFDNGTRRVRTPLVAVVAASNEVPQDEGLLAFHDRFLVRVPVGPVGDASFAGLLALADRPSAHRMAAQPVHTTERLALAAAADRVALGEDFVAACTRLRQWLAGHGQPMSDRRWRQFVGLARTAAATEGRAALDRIDLWLAPYVAAGKPEECPALAAWFVEHVLEAPPTAAPWLERAVQAFERQLGIEQNAAAEGEDDSGAGKLALARAIGLTDTGTDGPEPMAAQRIVSARLEAQLRRRWSPLHVQARVAQVTQVLDDVRAAAQGVQAQAAALDAALRGRLWIPPALAGGWHSRHAAALALLGGLAERLAATRDGFAALPQDDSAPAEMPAPMAAADA